MDVVAMSPIFSDELITATELNRQPGRILDKALEHPITITRNDQSFALLRRDNMALFVNAAQQSRATLELINAAFRLLLNPKTEIEYSYNWLRVFDAEELNELIDEVMATYHSVDLLKKDWQDLDIIIHEWYESALAISNPELETAFNQND